jgi:uncharacterized protein YneF (UPF0154 family)
MDIWIIILGASLLILWILVWFIVPFFLIRHIIQYDLSKEAILIRLFNTLTVRRILIKDIEDLSVVKLSSLKSISLKYFTMFERWGNVYSEDRVLIRKGKGLSRNILISPANPIEFVQQVKTLRFSK